MMGLQAGLCAGIVIFSSGCGRVAMEAKAAPPPEPWPGGARELAGLSETTAATASTAPPDAAPMPTPAPAPSVRVAPSVGSATADTASREMLDIEAHLALLVANVNDARGQLRKQASTGGATITSDVVQDEGGSRQAALTIRVPAFSSNAFMADVERLGAVAARQITAQDVGREYHDSEIVLHNLERTLARYEEILQKAQTVDEILRIEGELSRIRGEIDRVKGGLRYLGDRASRATVYVVLRERPKEIAQPTEEVAKFFPGARAVALTTWRAGRGTETDLGGGLVVGAGRSLNVEIDALKHPQSGTSGFDAVLATLGGDAYSDFLGGGQRRFLNPYLGVRAGYARIESANRLVIGGTLGVELWKTRYATIDTDVRVLGLFGKHGSELGVQPTLGANVAF